MGGYIQDEEIKCYFFMVDDVTIQISDFNFWLGVCGKFYKCNLNERIRIILNRKIIRGLPGGKLWQSWYLLRQRMIFFV